jgi:hypothetical protein
MAGTFGLALAGSATIALAVGFAASRASAQTAGTAHHHDAAPSTKAGSHKHSDNEAAADPSRAVDETMSGAMTANPHMRMSPMRVASRADSARAAQLVNQARVALTKYKDVSVAERDGYRMFAPNIKNQPVYHFTNLRLAIRERFKFDPAQPSSLLYKRSPDGSPAGRRDVHGAQGRDAGGAERARSAWHRAVASAHEHVRAEADSDGSLERGQQRQAGLRSGEPDR